MVKPSGMFKYEIDLLAGDGGQVTKNLLVDPDYAGNLLSAIPGIPVNEIFNLLDWHFAPNSFAGNATGGLVRTGVSVSQTDGVLTALEVQVFNDNPDPGDTVSGFLFLRVHHRENLLL
jgi:hypothetical protein